eukprot:7383889-Pyramimonas_sp.AAC.1
MVEGRGGGREPLPSAGGCKWAAPRTRRTWNRKGRRREEKGERRDDSGDRREGRGDMKESGEEGVGEDGRRGEEPLGEREQKIQWERVDMSP